VISFERLAIGNGVFAGARPAAATLTTSPFRITAICARSNGNSRAQPRKASSIRSPTGSARAHCWPHTATVRPVSRAMNSRSLFKQRAPSFSRDPTVSRLAKMKRFRSVRLENLGFAFSCGMHRSPARAQDAADPARDLRREGLVRAAGAFPLPPRGRSHPAPWRRLHVHRHRRKRTAGDGCVATSRRLPHPCVCVRRRGRLS
jgi:hypothetical protein